MMAPRSPQFVQEEDELPLYVPGTQVEQLTASPSEYVPPSQDAHVVAPTRDVSRTRVRRGRRVELLQVPNVPLSRRVAKPFVQSKHASASARGA